MNKIIYTKPEIEIVLFEDEDIMTASNVVYGDQSLFDDEKTDFWF